jgi:gluconate 5-dehydrogenase
MSKEQDLKQKTALVTGSSTGLGLVLAEGLAEAGARVVLNGRNAERLEEAVSVFRSKGFDVDSQQFDITDSEDVAKGIAEIQDKYGDIDILVNNAGMQYRKPLEEFPLEAWDRIIQTNLTGAFIVSRAVVQGMISKKRGKIINICSLQAELGRQTIAPYAASKGGLKMLTRAMCVEWAQYNIQVNAIGPGYFATEMTRPLREDAKFDSWLRNRTPAGRWGDPTELVAPLLLFASSGSDFINGQILFVDGGIIAAI